MVNTDPVLKMKSLECTQGHFRCLHNTQQATGQTYPKSLHFVFIHGEKQHYPQLPKHYNKSLALVLFNPFRNEKNLTFPNSKTLQMTISNLIEMAEGSRKRVENTVAISEIAHC